MPDVVVERFIDAEPSAIWKLVADPTRMGEWSPENTGAVWLGEATGPMVGAQFRGSNKNGWMRWRTRCTVTDCVPDEHFAFDVTYGPVPISRWSFRLNATDGGTSIVQEFTDREPKAISKVVNTAMRIPSRHELNRSNMEATLAAIAIAVEADR